MREFAAREPSKRQSNYIIDIITPIVYNFLGKETFRKFKQSMTKAKHSSRFTNKNHTSNGLLSVSRSIVEETGYRKE